MRVAPRLLVSTNGPTSSAQGVPGRQPRGGVGDHDVDAAVARGDRVGERGDRRAVAHVEELAADVRPRPCDPCGRGADAIRAGDP